jgi:hypothetical protein
MSMHPRHNEIRGAHWETLFGGSPIAHARHVCSPNFLAALRVYDAPCGRYPVFLWPSRGSRAGAEHGSSAPTAGEFSRVQRAGQSLAAGGVGYRERAESRALPSPREARPRRENSTAHASR